MKVLSDLHVAENDIKKYSADVVYIKDDDISSYDNDEGVVAVVGSRALAQATLKLNLPNLKLFQLTSAGFDGVAVNEFKNKGIYLCNAGSVYSVPIAETVIYGMLQFAKRYWENPKHKFLRPLRGYKYIEELDGKNLLIMACGNIGTAVAQRAAAFGMNVCGYDPYCENKLPYSVILRSREELLENLGQFDYIVSTMPDNENTRGFVDSELFAAMKNSAVIVNVGRKAVFNENDFLKALKSKQIGGAVLDMYERFPNPITNKFRRLSNVIILPAVAAISKEVRIRRSEHITKNVCLVLNGEIPYSIISK